MISNLVEQLQTLDDFHAVKFVQHFSQMLLDGFEDDPEVLLSGIPDSLRTIPEYTTVENIALGEAEAQLTDVESIALSKTFLDILVQDPAIFPLLEKAWDTYTAKEAGASKTVLSGALAASMVLFVATSEAKFSIGDATFEKKAASPELVKAITEPIIELGKTTSGYERAR